MNKFKGAMKMKFEDFKSEIEKIDNNLSVEKYGEDQIVMIGLTLQDRKAGDIEVLLDGVVSVLRISTDDDGNRFLQIKIRVAIDSFDTIFKILNLAKEYMEALDNE
ncbi:hypothetical protein B6U39_03965 [Ligilactobacillus salivarius]|uniref:Uncharacterized protein n=2 Tax=Ligilactobacillus salivarius TaxID=1624 RepID=A0A1V9TV83_9LACO|nr:hypothetical protein B6U39_03965 [Ligilactobacillus salivarius]OQR23660.1 hypothetical protein B6U38_03995 [Ligilactobacillus salivarius]OQR25653.1 hypothetical protein B6U37_03980 [Ligilactobacillus salivarius]